MPEHSIFRENAINSYKRSMEKDVVARLISGPIIVCLWVLLGVLMVAALFAWIVQVPIYANGSGIVLAQGNMSQSANERTTVILFLPLNQAAQVRAGLPVDLQIGSAGMSMQSTITQVGPGEMSPAAIRQRYQLKGMDAFLITEPSVVAIVKADSLPASTYAGSLVAARIEIGSQRLLSLLPGSGQFLGGNS